MRTAHHPRQAQMLDLSEAAHRAQHLRTPAVFVTASPARDIAAKRDRERIQQLEAALASAEAINAAAVLRAQREARVDAVTIRVIDRRADWYAKQPKARSPRVILSPERMITCEVWQQPPVE